MKERKNLDGSALALKGVFFVALIGIALLYLIFSFSGLNHKYGLDQAQAGREVARGNGLTTKVIRPIYLQQLEEADKPINLQHVPETYHAPLNVLVYAGVLKMVGGDNPDNYKMETNDTVYKLDRVIVITCMIFFMISIGINYLLISRIFDTKIASVVAILMMVSQFFWEFTQSGLPQMLMLMLFSAALYMVWRAVELQESGGKPFVPAIISGFFFALLVLSHWITIWIFIGYLIFAAFYFNPKGLVAVTLLGILLLFIAAPLVYYASNSNGLFGTAFYVIHGGGGLSEEIVMRTLNTPGIDVKATNMRFIQSFFLQAGNIHNYLGGLIIAPAFFIALLHPFKRSSISKFRWVVALMWIFAAIGMAIVGVSESGVDPNQIHLLFMPVMSAYAVAMMSIIWSRVPLSQEGGLMGNLHIAVIILITAGPLIMSLMLITQRGASSNSTLGVNAASLNGTLSDSTAENSIIVSDQPFAVAWYADRQAIWMPRNIDQLVKLETIADRQAPISGLHFTQSSYLGHDVLRTFSYNGDLTPIAYTPWIGFMTQRSADPRDNMASNESVNKLISKSTGRYRNLVVLENLFSPSFYYSRESVDTTLTK